MKKIIYASYLQSTLIDLVFLIAPLHDMRLLKFRGFKPDDRTIMGFFCVNDRNKCSSKYACTDGFNSEEDI